MTIRAMSAAARPAAGEADDQIAAEGDRHAVEDLLIRRAAQPGAGGGRILDDALDQRAARAPRP